MTKRQDVETAQAGDDDLAQAVRDYLDERDNPAPDLTMRMILLRQVRGALERYEALNERLLAGDPGLEDGRTVPQVDL